MHTYSHTHTHRFTAASLSPDRACQENYTLITLTCAWNRHPYGLPNTVSDSLSHRRPLTQLQEIHSAVTHHLTLKVKQEGRLSTNVFLASYFPITSWPLHEYRSDVYCIASFSNHIQQSTVREVRYSPHTGRECLIYLITCLAGALADSSSGDLLTLRYWTICWTCALLAWLKLNSHCKWQISIFIQYSSPICGKEKGYHVIILLHMYGFKRSEQKGKSI